MIVSIAKNSRVCALRYPGYLGRYHYFYHSVSKAEEPLQLDITVVY